VTLPKKLDEYLALRRATGFKFLDAEFLLRNFVAFARRRHERCVRAATAIEWAGLAKQQPQRHRRLRIVARFAQFLRSEDPRHEIPPEGIFYARAVRPCPHVFSEDEIQRIVAAAAELGPPGSLRPKMYSTLFGLLATTGLRLSEATGLKLTEITDDGLVVRETKFRKSRLVPIHETTRAALARYVAERWLLASNAAADRVFLTRQGTRPSHGIALSTFREVCEHAGVAPTASGTPPRIHDLRHTFAVRALEHSPVGRDRVEQHMLALSVYLGHARVESTYWYLERTPRLLRDIARACEATLEGGSS